ncbi:hypothetical protein TNCV_1714621 [Trichonephila clavipes]|nr:hypothetical protein TNCV_1714621 [Trichonephila clavipes]
MFHSPECRICVSFRAFIGGLTNVLTSIGHSPELVTSVIESQVQVVVPLKSRLAGDLFHVKPGKAKSVPIGMLLKLGQGWGCQHWFDLVTRPQTPHYY